MNKPSKDVYCPTDSSVSDSTFCVAGNAVIAVFIRYDQLKSPTRLKIAEPKDCTLSSLSSPNVSILEEENERLRKENESLRKMIKEQDLSSLLNELKKSKERNEEQEMKIKELQDEKSQLLKKINKSKHFQNFEYCSTNLQMEPNHYKLMKLTKSEIKNVELFVTSHKTKNTTIRCTK